MIPAKSLIPSRLLTDQLPYKAREALKQAARDALGVPGISFDERRKNALLVCLAWWQRNRPGCATFDKYMRHLLSADRPHERGGTVHESWWGADVVAAFIAEFGLTDRPRISPGYSDYERRRSAKPRKT